MPVTGKMKVLNETISGSVEILNRPPYEGVPMTLADGAFAEDEVVKAGAIIKAGGEVSEDGSGAVGILLFDVYKDRPQGTILKKAYVNVTRIKESLGEDFTTQYGANGENIASTIQALLPMIVFEEIPTEE